MRSSAWETEELFSLIEEGLGRGPSKAQEPARAVEEEERLLTPDEAARLLGVTKRWLYRHSKELPFARKLSRKCLRFSLRGLRRWQETRRP